MLRSRLTSNLQNEWSYVMLVCIVAARCFFVLSLYRRICACTGWPSGICHHQGNERSASSSLSTPVALMFPHRSCCVRKIRRPNIRAWEQYSNWHKVLPGESIVKTPYAHLRTNPWRKGIIITCVLLLCVLVAYIQCFLKSPAITRERYRLPHQLLAA